MPTARRHGKPHRLLLVGICRVVKQLAAATGVAPQAKLRQQLLASGKVDGRTLDVRIIAADRDPQTFRCWRQGSDAMQRSPTLGTPRRGKSGAPQVRLGAATMPRTSSHDRERRGQRGGESGDPTSHLRVIFELSSIHFRVIFELLSSGSAQFAAGLSRWRKAGLATISRIMMENRLPSLPHRSAIRWTAQTS